MGTPSGDDRDLASNPGPCCRCGGAPEPGFVIDVTLGWFLPSRWVGGEPQRGLLGGVKTIGRPTYPLEAFRCSRCGRVELFALGSGADIPSKD
jgi:hypothetical protein